MLQPEVVSRFGKTIQNKDVFQMQIGLKLYLTALVRQLPL